MEAGASHGWSSGPSRARGGGGHPFAVLTRSSPPLCAGVPKGAGGRSGPTPSSDGQRGRGPEGSCRPELGGGGRGLGARVTPPRRREGWEGAGLPLRTAAAHCSRRQSSRGRILPGSRSTRRDTVPRGQRGQPGVGRLRPRCWQGTRAVSSWGAPLFMCAGARLHPSSPERFVCPWGELAGVPHVKLGDGSLRSRSQQIKSSSPCHVLLRVSPSLKTSSRMPRNRDRQPPGMARLCHTELPVPGTRTPCSP